MSGPSYGALLDAVRGVHWPARSAIAGAHGGHASLDDSAGRRRSLPSIGLYRQGDDPRRLDWRLLARSDRAYIRLATDRAVFADDDRARCVGVDGFSRLATRGGKWRRAQEIAVGLAAVAHADGDPVGVVAPGAGDAARVLPPRTRRGVVSEIARVVDGAHPEGTAPLAPAVASLRAATHRDHHRPAGRRRRAVARGARAQSWRGGEVHVVHVVAREEIDPPRRAILAADPEQPSIAAFARRVRTRVGTPTRSASGARTWRAGGARRARSTSKS